MKISRVFLLALILIFIVAFVQIGFSLENKKEKTFQEKTITNQQKPSEKDLKPQEEKKIEKKKSTPSKEAQQEYDEAELLRESQRNLDRSLSILNTVATLIGVLVGLLVLIVTIAGATGFFSIKRWATVRKEMEQEVKYFTEFRSRAEEDLDSMRKEAKKIHKPSLLEEPSIEAKETFDYFGRRLGNFEALGLLLKSEDYNNRGLNYLNKEMNSLALKDFEKAIELKPDDADAWYYKSHALHNLKRYDEALEAINIVLESNPEYSGGQHQRGCTLFELEQYKNALGDFEKALESEPELFPAWMGKALSLYNLKRYDEALEVFNKAVKLNPEYDEAWFYRGCVYSIKRNKEKTLSDLSRAIGLNVKNKKDAKSDEDFKWLWEDKEFIKITS